MWTRAVAVINQVVEKITMMFIVIMVSAVFLQVVSRALFSYSFAWTDELVRYMMIWVIFLGIGICFKYREHISIDLLFNRLSFPLQKALQVIIALLCMFFALLLIVKGLELSGKTMVNKTLSLQIPMGYVFYVIPASGVLIILNVMDITINMLKAKKAAMGES